MESKCIFFISKNEFVWDNLVAKTWHYHIFHLMCQAPHRLLPQLTSTTVFRLRRLQRRTQIKQLLEQTTQTERAQLNVLAIKLERLLFRQFPRDYGYLTNEALGLKLRHIVKDILTAKQQTPTMVAK
ncbi:unnamed protein product [Aphanomyces euteiches]